MAVRQRRKLAPYEPFTWPRNKGAFVGFLEGLKQIANQAGYIDYIIEDLGEMIDREEDWEVRRYMVDRLIRTSKHLAKAIQVLNED